MVESDGQAPDLQSILATLANFAPPQPNQPQTQAAGQAPTENAGLTSAERSGAQDPRLRPQRGAVASPKPMIDPSSITTWQDGLRCVTKIAAQNGQFAASIRKMMENQRRNEMRWYSERQALKRSQNTRERASVQASEILKGLSTGTEVESANSRDAADLEKELAAFDCKIHAAQLQMEVAMTAELKTLGVPFFGTDPRAVAADGSSQVLQQASSNRPKHSPLVTEKQLLELRRRMVEHLEALYRD